MLQFNSHLEWAWQPPKSLPVPISLIFSKDPGLLLDVGLLVTHSTFSESGSVCDHIFNYSREHMLTLIHFQIEECCESREPSGSHLQRGKRCVTLLTPLTPNKIKFTSKAGHSFGANKMKAGTRSQHSMCIPSSCTALRARIRAAGHHEPGLQALVQQAQPCVPVGPVSINP